MNYSLDHAWKTLQADSTELPDNPHLEKRLMQELHRQQKPRSMWRKLAIAAGLLVGCLALGSGIAVAAGYNPFRTFEVFFNTTTGEVTVFDENGQPAQGVTATVTNVDPKTGEVTVTATVNQPGTTTINVSPSK